MWTDELCSGVARQHVDDDHLTPFLHVHQQVTQLAVVFVNQIDSLWTHFLECPGSHFLLPTEVTMNNTITLLHIYIFMPSMVLLLLLCLWHILDFLSMKTWFCPLLQLSLKKCFNASKAFQLYIILVVQMTREYWEFSISTMHANASS